MVMDHYSSVLGATRFRVNANEFGYVRRDRCFWANVNGKKLDDDRWRTRVEQMNFKSTRKKDVRGKEEADEWVLKYVGTKPIPSSVALTGGYRLPTDPKEVVAMPCLGIQTFTQEFFHKAIVVLSRAKMQFTNGRDIHPLIPKMFHPASCVAAIGRGAIPVAYFVNMIPTR